MAARSLSPRVALLAAAAFGAALGATSPASAQELGPEVFYYRTLRDQLAFDVQLFEPSPSTRSLTSIDLARVSSHLSVTASLWTNYALRPWVLQVTEPGRPTETRPLVGNLFQSELQGSIGLFEYFELGLAMPVVLTTHATQRASDELLDPSGPQELSVRPGDLRLFAKVPFLRGDWQLGARLGASVPIGGRDAFSGNISWTFTPALLLSRTVGPAQLALNLGYRFRERNGLSSVPLYGPFANGSFALDDELVWGWGAAITVHPRVVLNGELHGRISVSGGDYDFNRVPIEADVSGAFRLTDALQLTALVGRGLTPGYGAPQVRGVVGLRFTVTRNNCSNGPEDYDGFEDGDYCADLDNDGDGIADAADRCPNDPEDPDGFLDQDGCPERDNDADGIADDDDRCPIEPEDQDGTQDTDGCPETDNDRDRIADVDDLCRDDPEDIDNYQDDDGCPEPGPEAATVTRTDSHLLLSQRVFFDYDSDTIRSVSYPILNEVAVTLRNNPDIALVRIEGHTDGQGNAQYNLDLSFRRARAVVEYLANQGVGRERLEFRGYGSQHLLPGVDDASPDGQALNRRVEFTIMNQAGNRTPTTTPDSQQPNRPPRRRRHRAAPTPAP